MDYIITDRFVTPPEQQRYFTERFVYLPDTYQPNDRRRPIASPEQSPSRQDCGLPPRGQGFVFCSLGQTYKITPALWGVWMRLLHAARGSVLWLGVAPDSLWAPDNLRREAGARGIAPERLVFAEHCTQAIHLARLRLADLVLDTLPCNGHTTTSDALWAGAPVLTCAGETFCSRVAGSLLHAIGLPELVTTSLDAYEAVALRLARHPDELAGVRAKLAHNRAREPLFDTPRYVRNLEQAYRALAAQAQAQRGAEATQERAKLRQ